MEKISWPIHVRNLDVVYTVKDRRNTLHTTIKNEV